MPKFVVCLGRLTRETATLVVEAPSKEALESRLKEVYEDYDGDWGPDLEWGCEESEFHSVVGEAQPSARPDVTLK